MRDIKVGIIKKYTYAQVVNYNLVFDSVEGKEFGNQSIEVLHKNGELLTVCGPEKYIVSKKLS